MTPARAGNEELMKPRRDALDRGTVWVTLRHVNDEARTRASILVVEDDEQIAELMRDFLEAEGFRVRRAEAASRRASNSHSAVPTSCSWM